MAAAAPDRPVQLHPDACVEPGAEIGEGTRIWAFTHVLAGARIGRESNLCDHVFVEGGVTLGNRVTVKSGVQLWEGLVAEDDVFIGPGAAFANDPRPRSRKAFVPVPVRLERGCSIGANATVLPGVTVGAWALVGAGAVVTRDVASHRLVIGNPARPHGWVCRCAARVRPDPSSAASVACAACGRRWRLDAGQLAEA